MRVIWSPRAIEDVEEIRDHIALESPDQAATVVARVVAAAESLADFAGRGRVVPELGDEQVRELIVVPFRLVYRLGNAQVEIVTILRSSRSFPRLDL